MRVTPDNHNNMMAGLHEDVLRSSPQRLARLIEITETNKAEWQPEDLEAIFRHQLMSPLEVPSSESSTSSVDSVTIHAREKNRPKTFFDLFHHPSPPIQLLEGAKNFAKANWEHPESFLPHDVALALYYTSIATALVRFRKRITRLADTQLKAGFTWALDQAWVSESTRILFEEGLRILDEPALAGT